MCCTASRRIQQTQKHSMQVMSPQGLAALDRTAHVQKNVDRLLVQLPDLQQGVHQVPARPKPRCCTASVHRCFTSRDLQVLSTEGAAPDRTAHAQESVAKLRAQLTELQQAEAALGQQVGWRLLGTGWADSSPWVALHSTGWGQVLQRSPGPANLLPVVRGVDRPCGHCRAQPAAMQQLPQHSLWCQSLSTLCG